jgi:hypothetical protein
MKIIKTEKDNVIETKMIHDSGEVDILEFRPKEGGRNRYLLNGKSVTGVTTILNVVAKPQITEWAIKLAYEDCLDKTKDQIRKILEDKDWASKKVSGEAMSIGTEAHAWVESYAKAHIKGHSIPSLPDDKDLHGILQPFVDWCNGRKSVSLKKNSYDKNSINLAPIDSVKFIESEMSAVSKKHYFAGSFDLLLEINGKKYMADFKTSSGIYGDSYFHQCAAYWLAWNEMGYDRDIVGAVVIRSGKKGNDFEVDARYDFEKHSKAFLAALIIYKKGDTGVEIEELV